MPDAISNTSPLLYLHRADAIELLPKLFGTVRISPAVVQELSEGRHKGIDVPDPESLPWVHIESPRATPSDWLSLDLGAGELAAMALGLENVSIPRQSRGLYVVSRSKRLCGALTRIRKLSHLIGGCPIYVRGPFGPADCPLPPAAGCTHVSPLHPVPA